LMIWNISHRDVLGHLQSRTKCAFLIPFLRAKLTYSFNRADP
jgi:hypothetical protein